MESNLLECIRQVKQKFKQNGQCASSNADLLNNQKQKNKRAKSVSFINNQDVNSKLIPVLELKDKLLKLREIEVKKYRKELAEAMNKNEELTKYCQSLGNQFTCLMNEMSGRNTSNSKGAKKQSMQNSKTQAKENQIIRNKDCKKQMENREPNMKENSSRRQKKPVSIKIGKEENNKKKLVSSKSGKSLYKGIY